MPWDDWDDEDELFPRQRRRGEEGDSLRRRGPPQGGVVTGAGVVTIIIGVLFLLCGVCSGFVGVLFAGVGQMARHQGNVLPPALFEVTGGVLLGWAILHLALGVLNLIGGILVLQRSRFGRLLTLGLAMLNGILGVGQLVLCVLLGMNEIALFDADPDAALVKAAIWGVIALLYVGQAVFVCIVLFNSHNKEEFE